VVPGLYRGGQPTPAGFRFLKWRGIKTVINLREEHDQRELVEKLGMKYVHIPLNAWDPVSDDAIRTFFRAVNDPANQPVFVHCQRGTDRTGVMVGFYRIAFEGWDGPRAYKEARAIGMRWWYRGLKKQLLGFAERRAMARDLLVGK
jgi:protein tyrosine/serine phosphatase